MVTDYYDAKLPTTSEPDPQQIRYGNRAEKRFYRQDRKGQFKPWALIRSPEWGRAFRFVYPIILVGSFSRAYLFDVESAHLVDRKSVV